jgi:hypothetical protein
MTDVFISQADRTRSRLFHIPYTDSVVEAPTGS